MSKRSDALYIADIIEAIGDIESFTKDMTFETFANDSKTVHAVVRCIEIIGEAAVHLSDQYRTDHPDVPWTDIIGMRNKMIHEYFGIDREILWKTITEDIPTLTQLLQ